MKKIIFKKINFLNFKASHFLKIINKSGLFVFPSGPGLATIDKNDNYLISLQNSDYVFFDSGYFVLLLRILKGIKVSKFSGYKFLKLFFCFLKKNNKKSILCIDPNFKISVSNRKYLKKLGIKKIYNYIAPKYNTDNLKDLKLVNKINKIKPNYIITNIGGGVQEILGYYLKKN